MREDQVVRKSNTGGTPFELDPKDKHGDVKVPGIWGKTEQYRMAELWRGAVPEEKGKGGGNRF